METTDNLPYEEIKEILMASKDKDAISLVLQMIIDHDIIHWTHWQANNILGAIQKMSVGRSWNMETSSKYDKAFTHEKIKILAQATLDYDELRNKGSLYNKISHLLARAKANSPI